MRLLKHFADRFAVFLPVLFILMVQGCVTMSSGERRASSALSEDQGIELKASNRLRERFGYNRDVSINVLSFNRTALITGYAPDFATKLEIGNTVARVENVRQVVNEVHLARPADVTTTTQDAYLSSRVKISLSDKLSLNTNAVLVHTESSTVYLMGLVTKREADSIAFTTARVPGVRRVVRAFEIISESQLAAINSAPPSQDNRTVSNAPGKLSTPNPTPNDQSQAVYRKENEELKKRLEEQRKQQDQALADAQAQADAEIARIKAEAEASNSKPTAALPNFNYAKINEAHALVIGNSAYPGSAKLANPVNDAKAISAKLRSLGFKVTELPNATRSQMVRGLSEFSRKAENADLTLLFYAGHGVQISGVNYMIPVDMSLTDAAQATLDAVSLNSVVEQYLPGKTKLVFLDACRDNPLMAATSRGISKGLAPINVSEGTLISYATKDGQTAADGTGQKNSPYTAALLEHLGDPQDIGIILRTVRSKVMQRTNNRQQPWEYGSLTGGALVLSTIKN